MSTPSFLAMAVECATTVPPFTSTSAMSGLIRLQAAGISQSARGKNSRARALAYNNLAYALGRQGRFTEARHFKAAREPYRILFPIPATQLQTNSQLTQNPGY